jgi:hypothetical protein
LENNFSRILPKQLCFSLPHLNFSPFNPHLITPNLSTSFLNPFPDLIEKQIQKPIRPKTTSPESLMFRPAVLPAFRQRVSNTLSNQRLSTPFSRRFSTTPEQCKQGLAESEATSAIPEAKNAETNVNALLQDVNTGNDVPHVDGNRIGGAELNQLPEFIQHQLKQFNNGQTQPHAGAGSLNPSRRFFMQETHTDADGKVVTSTYRGSFTPEYGLRMKHMSEQLDPNQPNAQPVVTRHIFKNGQFGTIGKDVVVGNNEEQINHEMMLKMKEKGDFVPNNLHLKNNTPKSDNTSALSDLESSLESDLEHHFGYPSHQFEHPFISGKFKGFHRSEEPSSGFRGSLPPWRGHHGLDGHHHHSHHGASHHDGRDFHHGGESCHLHGKPHRKGGRHHQHKHDNEEASENVDDFFGDFFHPHHFRGKRSHFPSEQSGKFDQNPMGLLESFLDSPFSRSFFKHFGSKGQHGDAVGEKMKKREKMVQKMRQQQQPQQPQPQQSQQGPATSPQAINEGQKLPNQASAPQPQQPQQPEHYSHHHQPQAASIYYSPGFGLTPDGFSNWARNFHQEMSHFGQRVHQLEQLANEMHHNHHMRLNHHGHRHRHGHHPHLHHHQYHQYQSHHPFDRFFAHHPFHHGGFKHHGHPAERYHSYF